MIVMIPLSQQQLFCFAVGYVLSKFTVLSQTLPNSTEPSVVKTSLQNSRTRWCNFLTKDVVTFGIVTYSIIHLAPIKH